MILLVWRRSPFTSSKPQICYIIIVTSTHAMSTTHKLGIPPLTISEFQMCEFFSLSDSAYASIAPSRDTSRSQSLFRYPSAMSATEILRDLPMIAPKRLWSTFLGVQSRVLSSGDAVIPPVRVCSMSICSTPCPSLWCFIWRVIVAFLMTILVAQPTPCKTRIPSTSSLSVWFCGRLINSCSRLAVRDQTCLNKLSIEIEGGDVVWGGHFTDGLQKTTRRGGGL